MLIMYNGEISLRGISLRNPNQAREERGLAPGGGERWTGQRRALNELVPVLSESWLGGIFGIELRRPGG